ncbi:hypothetical protein Taro_033625 [Colocasia esculenta]|uniref:Uncharacterized protein n=1 Tax=Colocasia esculenta TaxID=4460 RepID=A0A843VYF9_COLES|nr:hypothetical protein [Colocasia esculenta]
MNGFRLQRISMDFNQPWFGHLQTSDITRVRSDRREKEKPFHNVFDNSLLRDKYAHGRQRAR